MRGLALSGDRDSALTQYEECRRILDQELGIEPELETRALYERICAGELSPVRLSAPAPAHNLPAQLTPFVGRESELVEITSLLGQPDVRLLTLVGAGGMGKTRLALETARARLDAFRHGVFFVSLAPLSFAAAIAPTIASVIGLEPRGDPKAALLQFLRDKRLLLILDNFEHLLGSSEQVGWAESEAVGLVVEILATAPQVQIIVTSRERLYVRGEFLYQVQGMEYEIGDAAGSSAVRLFVQSARRVQPGFELSKTNLSEFLRLCKLVGGMPLGLELAAAWVETLPLDQIAAEIERSADFLTSEWRDVPERQQSMRAVFEWSWKLLNESEQQVFRQLSVFRGGFTREAAQAMAGASLRVLTRLVHKSLLRHAQNRYEIHELLRQFAAEQLDALPEERPAVEARHGEFYLNFVAERESRLARDEPREAATEILDEIANVRKAWAWTAHQGRLVGLERSVYSLWQFYWLMGFALEGEDAFRLAADCVRPSTDAVKNSHALLSKLLAVQALFMNRQSKFDQAIQVAQQAIAWAQASQERTGEALGYVCWGQALYRKGSYHEARPHIERALDLAQRNRSDTEPLREVELEAHAWLGMLEKDAGNYQASRAHLLQALETCRNLGKRREESRYLVDLGEISMIVGDYGDAFTHLQAALQIARVSGVRAREGTAQLALGLVALAQGRYPLAYDLLWNALEILHAIGDRTYEAYTLAYLGHLTDCLGDYIGAHDFLERASQLSEDVGSWEPRFFGRLFLALLSQHLGDHETARRYAEQSHQIALQAGDRSRQADAWLVIGRAQEGLGHLMQAAMAYQDALALYAELARTHMTAEPRAGLARLALAHGNLSKALGQVEGILSVLAQYPHAGLDEPFHIYLTCYRVLEANHDPRAASVLATASSLLDESASHFAEESQRQAFLNNVPSHHELMQVHDRTDVGKD